MIRSLQHAAVTVPNLEEGRRFYSTFGLESRELGSDLVFRCAGRAQDQLRLIEGAKKRLTYVSFGTIESELPLLKQRLQARGVDLLDPPVKEGGEGIWFRDPGGDLVNIRVADAVPQTRPAVLINNCGDYRRAGLRGAPDRNVETRPQRLGHLIKFTTDVERGVEFYTGVLGMKVSDRIRGAIAFLRCGNDGDHHVLGLAHSDRPGLHHMSFEVGNLDQMAFGAQKMLDAGYRNGWGMGRHIYGSNYFHYIRDPWMSMVEYFWDIDYIPEGSKWEPQDAEPGPHALFQWATNPPPEDFVTNYEPR